MTGSQIRKKNITDFGFVAKSPSLADFMFLLLLDWFGLLRTVKVLNQMDPAYCNAVLIYKATEEIITKNLTFYFYFYLFIFLNFFFQQFHSQILSLLGN